MRRPAPFTVADRTVLVTGAASGIGAALAREAHARGARVALVDVAAEVEEVARGLGERAVGIVADITDSDQIERAAARAREVLGPIDVVVANAGIAARPLRELRTGDDETFARVIDVNLLGTWRTVRASLDDVVERRGHVLLTASVYAFANGMANAPYAASKAAVEQLGRALRVELARTGASAGVLFPGWVDSPIVRNQPESPFKRLRRWLFPGPWAAFIDVDRVARAAVDGIERRAGVVLVPGRWWPVYVLRGIVQPLADAVWWRSRFVRDRLAEHEQVVADALAARSAR